MKRLLTTAIALALLLPGCSSEEPKSTEQPAQTQEAQQVAPSEAPASVAPSKAPVVKHVAAAAASVAAPKSSSIDDAPTVNAKEQAEPERAEQTEAAEEAPAQAEVHLVSMNRKSHKYHEAGCRYYGCKSCDEMPLSEAEAEGGIPCQKCH